MKWLATLVAVCSLMLTSCLPESLDVPEEVDLDVSKCIPTFTNSSLDIVTWNLGDFPLTTSSINYVEDLIDDLDADVIAIQGVKSPFAISELVQRLPDWEGLLHSQDDHLLGFLYKPKEVTITYPKTEVILNDSNHSPVSTAITHLKSGEIIHLFNLQFICCENSMNSDSRVRSISRFKEFIDKKHPEDNVVIVGDFREAIETNNEANSLNPFIEDTRNYLFVDIEIASGDSKRWSSISEKAHFDHIIVSNELFNKVTQVSTIQFSDCIPNYVQIVSDHFPVYASFEL